MIMPEPGQIWEHTSGRHTGARFQIVQQVEGWPDFWVVRSLTAKDRKPREVYWPDAGARVALAQGGDG